MFVSSLQNEPVTQHYKCLLHLHALPIPSTSFTKMPNNKENIPPFSTNKKTPLPLPAPSFKKTFKRRLRKPLADISKLFHISAQETDFPQLPSSFVSVCSTSNSRKRRVTEVLDLGEGTTGAKPLRMGFR